MPIYTGLTYLIAISTLLYPPSERSETGGYYVFTCVCQRVRVCVCVHMAAVFHRQNIQSYGLQI